ncbi:MAG: hypothetical protein JWM73_2551, partial [Solirubrobacterales bacterium]|nr:hypothetical protein [Solirubrobacterales bacterium]
DLDAGRQREAALQLSIALETALAELAAWTDRADLATRVGELAGLEDAADTIAGAALERGLDEAEAADVERILGRVEAALRARSAAGFA